MKAYKYHRFIQGWHWSASVGEDFIYIPEAKVIIYEGSGGGEKYKGISSDAKFIEEADEYISQVKSGNIKKYLNEEHEEFAEGHNVEKIYSIETVGAGKKTYINEIPERKTDKTIFSAISLSGFEEVELGITLEEIQEIINEQQKFTLEKAEFELKRRKFEDNIKAINNLIVKS